MKYTINSNVISKCGKMLIAQEQWAKVRGNNMHKIQPDNIIWYIFFFIM